MRRTLLNAGLLLVALTLSPAASAQVGLIAVEAVPVSAVDLEAFDDAERRHAAVAGEHGIAPLADWIAPQPDGGALHVRLWDVPHGRALQSLRHDERCGAPGHAGHDEHGWLLTKARGRALEAGELVWLRLVVPREGHGLREHAELDRAVAPITDRYGIRPLSELVALEAGAGSWAGVALVELWSVPDPGSLERLLQDPEWIELARRRSVQETAHHLSGLLAYAR